MMTPSTRLARQRAFTLVELLVVVAIAAVLVLLAAPSFKRYTELQRLRGVNAQLVTDFQFARNEAAARGENVWVRFLEDSASTCYVIFTTASNTVQCDCTRPLNTACNAAANTRELRTVKVPKDANAGVKVTPTSDIQKAVGFDYRTGGIVKALSDSESVPINGFEIDVFIDGERWVRTALLGTGRVTACKPDAGSIVTEPAC